MLSTALGLVAIALLVIAALLIVMVLLRMLSPRRTPHCPGCGCIGPHRPHDDGLRCSRCNYVWS